MSFAAGHSQRSRALEGTTFWLLGHGRGEARAPEEELEGHEAESPAGLHKAKAETQRRGGSDVGKKWQMRRVGPAKPSCSPCSIWILLGPLPTHPPCLERASTLSCVSCNAEHQLLFMVLGTDYDLFTTPSLSGYRP